MEFVISEKALNLVMSKLASLPYSDVSEIFSLVNKSIRPMIVEKEKEE
jgi:hypothetical protein